MASPCRSLIETFVHQLAHARLVGCSFLPTNYHRGVKEVSKSERYSNADPVYGSVRWVLFFLRINLSFDCWCVIRSHYSASFIHHLTLFSHYYIGENGMLMPSNDLMQFDIHYIIIYCLLFYLYTPFPLKKKQAIFKYLYSEGVF